METMSVPVSARRLLMAARPARNVAKGLVTSRGYADTAVVDSKPPIELLHIIKQQIKANGPMPLTQYMSLCLTHPTLGYYTKIRKGSSHVLGKSGDFITSPDISQVFGELLAVWCLVQWQKQGEAPNVRLIELGPGRGTLMRDMLNAFTSYKNFAPNLKDIHLVESSEFLKQEQRALIEGFLKKHQTTMKPKLAWHSSLNAVPKGPSDAFTLVVAHEFFDALPIILLEKRPEGWREVLVDEAPQSNIVSATPQAKLRLTVAPSFTPSASVYGKYPELSILPTGTRVEISPEAFGYANQIAKRVSDGKGGAALIVDYGDARSYGHSFRGFRNHQIVDPLAEPGSTDLTANVNFNWLRQAVEADGSFAGPMTQREFLGHMGIQVRVNRLIKSMSDDRADAMLKAAYRLVDAVGMGTEYKMAAILPKSVSERPYPFEAPKTASDTARSAQSA